MKKTSKILLGIIGGSWLLFICALFIPQCFEIEVERIDSDTTESSPQAKTYTKEINSPFKHIVINSSSNYDIKIYCNTQTTGNAKNITQIQNKYYGKDLSSYKLVNDTLVINLATDENDETPSWLSSDLTITTPNNITEITSSPIINYIKIHNLKSEHLSIKNSDNEGDETKHRCQSSIFRHCHRHGRNRSSGSIGASFRNHYYRRPWAPSRRYQQFRCCRLH